MKKFNIEKFNDTLRLFNQQTRAVEITGQKIVLSNGVVLDTEPAVRKCKRRVSRQSEIYCARFDRLYSVDQEIRHHAEKEAKSKQASLGGKAVQQKHGESIKRNLNTGTPWNKNTAGNYPYSPWSKGLSKENNESLRRLSEGRKGSGNPMHGQSLTSDHKNKISEKMKALILSGEFTPNSNNRNTHWESSLDGVKYRSSWEALYKYINPCAEYEQLRIQYEYGIYIVDFVDHTNKSVIEVKPKELQTGKKFKAKINALSEWAQDKNYSVELFDQYSLIEILAAHDINFDRFDENTQRKLKALL